MAEKEESGINMDALDTIARRVLAYKPAPDRGRRSGRVRPRGKAGRVGKERRVKNGRG